MATRFGSSPRANYIVKLRWIVAGLVAVIMILITTLIVVTQSTKKENVAAAEDAAPQTAEASRPMVAIAIAARRIEVGTALLPVMLNSLDVPIEQMPEGSIPAREIPSLAGKFAKVLINANLPLTRDALSENRPAIGGKIPPGFRAATIRANVQDLVEGFVGPDSRVDVLYTFTDKRGEKKNSVLVSAAQILSVNGKTTAELYAEPPHSLGDVATVSLLLREEDARRLVLARESGSLTLILIGDQEMPKPVPQSGVIGTSSLVQNEAPEPEEPQRTGTMIETDEHGRPVTYDLIEGRWKRRLTS